MNEAVNRLQAKEKPKCAESVASLQRLIQEEIRMWAKKRGFFDSSRIWPEGWIFSAKNNTNGGSWNDRLRFLLFSHRVETVTHESSYFIPIHYTSDVALCLGWKRLEQA